MPLDNEKQLFVIFLGTLTFFIKTISVELNSMQTQNICPFSIIMELNGYLSHVLMTG